MPRSGWLSVAKASLSVCAMALVLGCEPKDEPAVQTHSARRAEDVAAARLADKPVATMPSDVPVRPVSPAETQPAPSFETIDQQVPDPLEEVERVRTELADIPVELKRIEGQLGRSDLSAVQRQILEEKRTNLIEKRTAYPDFIKRLDAVRRPDIVRLSLKEVIRRTMLNSHGIQVTAYNPAIEASRVVEAEAQFDAIFFSDFSNDKQNRPSSSELSGTDTQNRMWTAGVRKLLSSGMQVETGYNVTRTETDLIFQTLNPSYFNQFYVQFRQPILRGFGIDYNRSQIEARKLDRAIGEEQLRRQIRETLFNVEQAYWRLMQARRSLTVTARLLTNLENILYSLRQRLELGFDVYRVQVKLTESRYEQRQAEFARIRNTVRNSEDALKALMNDPDMNMVRDLEIIPTDEPKVEPFVLDILGEVTAALAYRTELHEARLQIEQAQVAIGVAKNQALPRLDLTFRYVVDGLGGNWDRAFKQMSDNDFNEYLLQLQFEWPIGNRGPEAQIRQARLRQAQAIASHRAQIEQTILETQTAIRDLYTAYDQIGPTLRSAQASQEQLFATQARQERRDVASLQVELDAHELLATSRQNLLQAMADYNIAIVNLERRKDTLLKYNNIVLTGVYDDSKLDPYRPVGP